MRRWRWLPWTVLVAMVGVWLGWRELTFRSALAVPGPAIERQARPVTTDDGQLANGDTVALAFGFLPAGAVLQSAERLTLKASFISSQGNSRVLLSDSTGERVYRVGDRLPGGSVLRRIEPGQVTLWRAGREEVLPLMTPAEPFFRRDGERKAKHPDARALSLFHPVNQPDTEHP